MLRGIGQPLTDHAVAHPVPNSQWRAHPHRPWNSVRRQPVMSPENFSPIKSVISGRFDAIELCLQVPLFGSTINIYLIMILDLRLFSFRDARASSRKEHVGSSLCPITGALDSLDGLKNLTHPTTITLSATNLNYQRFYVHVHLYPVIFSSPSFIAWSLSGMLATFSLMNFWVTWV